MQEIKSFIHKPAINFYSNLNKRIIAHIDMNSYFATVEQQANPKLRGKPIAVSGKFIPEKLDRSVVAAASVEAKKRGVKTPMPLWEAMKICPDLLIIPGDEHKYETVTKKFLGVFERFTPEIEIFSIDEAFLDLTDVVQDKSLRAPMTIGAWQSPDSETVTSSRCTSRLLAVTNKKTGSLGYAPRDKLGTGWDDRYAVVEEIAKRIKAEIRSEIGEWFSCSIGIGPNKMIAKLASDQKKPNGLVVVPPIKVKSLLEGVELTDICGIAGQLKRRLNNLGIKKPLDMGKAPERLLTNEFGVLGKMLKLWGQGLDPSPIVPHYNFAAPKSMGHSYTLPKNTRNFLEIKKYFYHMSDKVGRRLRREGYGGRALSVLIRLSDFSHIFESKRYKNYFNDSFQIYELVIQIVKKWKFTHSVRLVGVSVSELTETKNISYPLLLKERKFDRSLKAQDSINNKFGELTITRGAFLKTKIRKQTGGFFEKEKLCYNKDV